MTVSKDVFRQFLLIREMGAVNMFDAQEVQKIALSKGYYDLARHLDNNTTVPLVMGDVEIELDDRTVPASDKEALSEEFGFEV